MLICILSEMNGEKKLSVAIFDGSNKYIDWTNWLVKESGQDSPTVREYLIIGIFYIFSHAFSFSPVNHILWLRQTVFLEVI